MLRGYSVKGLELAEPLQCLASGEMPFTDTFTKRTVVDTFPKPCHKVSAVATIRTQIGFELDNGHIVLIHLHGDKDMLKLGYFFLDFLVNDNGIRMIYHYTILPLIEGDTMP